MIGVRSCPVPSTLSVQVASQPSSPEVTDAAWTVTSTSPGPGLGRAALFIDQLFPTAPAMGPNRSHDLHKQCSLWALRAAGVRELDTTDVSRPTNVGNVEFTANPTRPVAPNASGPASAPGRPSNARHQPS
jgi:hypothetical protein